LEANLFLDGLDLVLFEVHELGKLGNNDGDACGQGIIGQIDRREFSALGNRRWQDPDIVASRTQRR
jgi:hypothetical protein